MNRRDLLKTGIIPIVASGMNLNKCDDDIARNQAIKLSGNVNHSACRWCYSSIPLDEFIDRGKDLGLKSIELLNVDEIKLVTSKGLTCAIANGSDYHIPRGFNDPMHHDKLLKDYELLIPQVAEYGIEQIICFSGNRNGVSDEQGLEHCARGLDPVVKLGEKYGVKVVMELLNSKVDHKDYQCDHTSWGVALAEKIGSDHFKLLYDIYHMQIMEGDVIATIKNAAPYISHYHTGGVPGRNEINQSQELNYVAIMKAIVETGYNGFVAQEFIPKREDKLESLKEGISICDV